MRFDRYRAWYNHRSTSKRDKRYTLLSILITQPVPRFVNVRQNVGSTLENYRRLSMEQEKCYRKMRIRFSWPTRQSSTAHDTSVNTHGVPASVPCEMKYAYGNALPPLSPTGPTCHFLAIHAGKAPVTRPEFPWSILESAWKCSRLAVFNQSRRW